jgi:hypothetical protein
MNIAVVPKTSKLIPRVETRYTVVVQYGKKPRQYIKCETMAATRETIVAYRKKKGVTYIQYNIPDEDHIEAYDVRDPRRYV